MVRKALQGCNISVFGRNPAWNQEQMKKIPGWLGHLSGKFASSISSSTTHLVVSAKRWREVPRPAPLQKALNEKADGRDLKIVTFEWLEDCLNSQSYKREGAYAWETIDAHDAKVAAKAAKAAEKAKTKAESVPGMMQTVFEESTEMYVDVDAKRKQEKQMEKEKEMRKARELEEKEEKMRRRQEQARIFGRGARKARNEILSDSHHIFQDTTGFKYDVLVTKVDTRHNRNERVAITIQIYESNTEPHTYSTNSQFAGTSISNANNTLTSTGVEYPTAFHAFKTEFSTRTGTEWDERISGHIKRLRSEKITQGQGTGSEPQGSVRGVPVSESAAKEKPFEEKKFEYHPPGYGPKGDVTPEERERLKGLGVTVTEGHKEAGERVPTVVLLNENFNGVNRTAIEEWLGRALTPAAESAPTLPEQGTTAETANKEADVEFDAMLAEANEGAEINSFLGEEYPFEKALNDAVDQHHGAGTAQAIDNGEITVLMDSVIGENEHASDAADPLAGLDFEFSGAGDDVWMHTDLPTDNQQLLAQQQSGEEDQTVADGGDAANHVSGDGPGGGTFHVPDDTQHDSLHPETPSFTMHPMTENSFQQGTPDIGETQVAEGVGGEFLKELSRQDSRQPSLLSSITKSDAADVENGSASAKNSGFGFGARLSGLNMGTSILGKRKVVPAVAHAGEDGERGKVQKLAEEA